ncbi:hypothetical protein [Rudanella lutea]|uniref:hypothetical protein n=1 Tax=Rudanella lutea TaxID=451374 RepID=UPI0009FCA8F0|nr:hypothetical protein [Rudanella lutea]
MLTLRLTVSGFVIASVLLLSGCGGGGKRKPKDEGTKPAEKVAGIGRIHFFLETSASMGGYLKGATTFKDVVSEVVNKSNQIAPVSVYTITDKPQPYQGGVGPFVEGLATTPLANGKSSKLHTIFGQVGAKATGNDVAVLVSDCILSFPDADIKRDPEINRNNASSVLKNQINDQFASLSRKGISATVYAYNSAFNGTYYDYQNKKSQLNGEQRPFYIWVIGKQSLVADFDRQLLERLSERPAQQLSFGSGDGLKKYELFFGLNKKGDWRAERGNVTEIKFGRKAEPAEFAIGLDLAGLPAYAQAPDYLKENLVIKADNATLKLVNVQRRENVNTTKRMTDREQQLLARNSHVLTFKIDDLFDDEATVNVRMPVRFDTWYQTDWSTMDDRTEAGRRKKTFALVHLMNGVREAYQTGTNDFVNFTFKLEK